MGANTRFRSLSDYIRNKANVRAKCRCGHVGVVDAVKFKRWVAAHGDNEWLEVCGGRLRCIECRGRPVSIKPTPEGPTMPHWMDREELWVRLVKRLRG